MVALGLSEVGQTDLLLRRRPGDTQHVIVIDVYVDRWTHLIVVTSAKRC